jgi:hypothetical protein
LRQQKRKLEALEVQVLVVTFEAAKVAADYALETGLPWPLLLDPTRSLYTAYGMGCAPWRKLWGTATWWAYARLMAKGERPRRPSGDTAQLGGDVLIDPAGRVAVLHVQEGPADRPTLSTLLRPVESFDGRFPGTPRAPGSP